MTFLDALNLEVIDGLYVPPKVEDSGDKHYQLTNPTEYRATSGSN